MAPGRSPGVDVALLDDLAEGGFHAPRVDQRVAAAELPEHRLDAHSGIGRDVSQRHR